MTRMKLCAVGLAVYLLVVFLFGEKNRAEAAVRQRLETIASTGRYRSEEDERLRLSFADRFWRPFYSRLMGAVASVLPISARAQGQLEDKLRAAGRLLSARDYLARQTLLAVCLMDAVFFTLRFGMDTALALCLLACLYTVSGYYVLARFSLGREITARQERLENDIPEILDLLSVSVSAGLGFDQALQYVTERCTGPLAEELTVTQREIRLGRSRNEALKNLSDRCGVEPLKTFVSAVIQADTMGIAISNVLKVQADNVRTGHKQKIEEKAAKLPVKILIPLVLCIFPVMFIILLGPAVPGVVAAFADM